MSSIQTSPEANIQVERSATQRSKASDLHRAIANGDRERIERLLSGHAGVPIEIRNAHGLTPLHVACVKKDMDLVLMLLRMGCNVNATTSFMEKTALALAAFAGELDIFEQLINQGASVDATDIRGWTVLHEAVLADAVDIIEYIVKVRPQMRIRADHQGRTPLHLAAFSEMANRRLLAALLGPTAPALHGDLLDTLTDHNDRGILHMARLHSPSNFSQWQKMLHPDEEFEKESLASTSALLS